MAPCVEVACVASAVAVCSVVGWRAATVGYGPPLRGGFSAGLGVGPKELHDQTVLVREQEAFEAKRVEAGLLSAGHPGTGATSEDPGEEARNAAWVGFHSGLNPAEEVKGKVDENGAPIPGEGQGLHFGHFGTGDTFKHMDDDANASFALGMMGQDYKHYLMDNLINLRYFQVMDPHRVLGLGQAEVQLTKQMPVVLNKFDWVLYKWTNANYFKYEEEQPVKNVFSLPISDNLVILQEWLKEIPPVSPNECRTLVIAGQDRRLSDAKDQVNEIIATGRFSRIYYEGMDIRIPGVDTIPMGFIGYYMVKNGLKNVMEAISQNKQGLIPKDHLLGAAWGAIWSDDLLATQGASARKDADDWVRRNMNWVRRMNVPFEEYYKTMSRYRFILTPPGAGVQAPKFAEAWIMRSVPVTIRLPAFHQLKAYGFPIFLVDNWDDLTQEKLEQFANSDEYRNINWDEVLNMLHVEPWSQRYLCP